MISEGDGLESSQDPVANSGKAGQPSEPFVRARNSRDLPARDRLHPEPFRVRTEGPPEEDVQGQDHGGEHSDPNRDGRSVPVPAGNRDERSESWALEFGAARSEDLARDQEEPAVRP